MEHKLYVKLLDQITRQTAERTAIESEMASAQPAIDAAQSALDAIDASDSEAILSARAALQSLKGPQDERQARVDALTAAIDQCTELIEGSGLNLSQAEIDAARAVMNVPERVTMRQARLALLGAGLLSSVNAAIDSLPEPAKSAALIEWEYSSEVWRNRPFVQQLGGALGLSSAQLDALFIQAATL